MIYGYDEQDPTMRKARHDGHAMFSGDDGEGSDLHASRFQADFETGYAMFGDEDARRVLDTPRGERWNRTMVKKMARSPLGLEPPSWQNPAESTNFSGLEADGYAGGGMLGMILSDRGTSVQDHGIGDPGGRGGLGEVGPQGFAAVDAATLDEDDDYDDLAESPGEFDCLGCRGGLAGDFSADFGGQGLGAPPTGDDWLGQVATINGVDGGMGEYSGGGLLGLHSRRR